MSWKNRSTAARIVSSSRSASKMIMTSYGRNGSYLLWTAARAPGRTGSPLRPASRAARSRLSWNGSGYQPSTWPIDADLSDGVRQLRGAPRGRPANLRFDDADDGEAHVVRRVRRELRHHRHH